VAIDLAGPFGNVLLERTRLAEGVEHLVGDVVDRDIDTGGEV
jgi:hypothetical protein